MSGGGRVLVLALGNPDAGDDAFGPLVADALRARGDPRLRVAELGGRGASGVLDALGGEVGVILVDAVTGPGMVPGELVDVDWRDPRRPELARGAALSSHAMSLEEQMALADRLGMLPAQVRVLGVAIESAGVGRAMAAGVRAAVPAVAARILGWARGWVCG